MREDTVPAATTLALRRDISARNLERAQGVHAHEQSYGPAGSVVYAPDDGVHGNFLPASYRRIVADPDWRLRLRKAYTSSRLMPRRHDRRRAELDCASSSDALLMNIFCYPGVLRRPGLCALLGVNAGLRPEFGVRALLPMRRGEVDRTEIDMRLGALLVEAKLTENGFGQTGLERLLRYEDAAEVFAVEDLPRRGNALTGWQLLRGILAARHCGARFVVLCDGRRGDLMEEWMRVVQAVVSCDLRSRIGLVTWQEIAGVVPPTMRRFLGQKYGILVR